MVVHIRDVITCFKFGDDRFRGLASAEGQILPFPIDFDGRPYNTLTLPCERVMLLAFWPSWGSSKTEISGFNFCRRSTQFYVTIFKMAGSKLIMPHIDPSELHTITNFVSELMFLIIKKCPGIC